MQFAESAEARWPGNFRDLNAAVTRMATLAHAGRITVDVVDAEIARLRTAWQQTQSDDCEQLLRQLLGDDRVASLDHFDRVQLAEVIRICRGCSSMAEAGRRLFAASRLQKSSTNDADRLRKYLHRFGLSWAEL